MNATPTSATRRRRTAATTWWRHTRWALRASCERLLRKPLATMMTVLVLGLALTMPLALWLLLGNAQRVLGSLGDGGAISVFLTVQAEASDARMLAERLENRADVAAVQLKSPDQGMAELAAVQGFGELVDDLPDNPLPWVLLVEPIDVDAGPTSLQLAQDLRSMPRVDQVQDQAHWRQRMRALINLGQRGFALLAILLGLAVLMVVGQTVRQDVRSRLDEISVLQMAGASPRFVRRPYLYAGALYGFVAGIIAVVLLLLMEALLASPTQTLLSSYGGHIMVRGLPIAVLMIVPLAAAVLGWVGARIVTRSPLQTQEV